MNLRAVVESQIVAGVAVILHERIGNWHRQLRPRLHDRGASWIETRSAADLEKALAGRSCPIVVVDLAAQVLEGLDHVELARSLAPGGLILVIDPDGRAEVCQLALELGATYVVSGSVPPPEVASLVSRWIELASRREEREGWGRSDNPENLPEPWNWLAPYLKNTH